MKKIVINYCCLIILNLSLFLLCFLYEGGIATSMLYPLLNLFLNHLNYKLTTKIMPFIFLNTIMLFSSVFSTKIMTKLYYNNISADNGTLAVGSFLLWFISIFMIVISLVTVIAKFIQKRKS